MIVQGIIQEKYLKNCPFKVKLVSMKGQANVRTGIFMVAKGITIHNTGNNMPTATALAHANWLVTVEEAEKDYIGAHFFVDDSQIVQVLPINEVAWHAGDGQGRGNMTTIAIEICEVGNILQAEENALLLIGYLRQHLGKLPIYKHQDWTGKYCPRVLLSTGRWKSFEERAIKMTYEDKESIKEATSPSPWAREAVAWAIQGDLFDKDSNLHSPVTREVLAIILWRFEKRLKDELHA
jgi:N-acetylmuramoyl-L-alanine amidase